MKTISKSLIRLFWIALPLTLWMGCDSNEPGDGGPGEEELITRVVLSLTANGTTQTFTAQDASGIGGGNLQTDPITLTAGTTYTGTIALFNDDAGEEITTEVEAEKDDHQFFYTAQGQLNGFLTITITDKDSNDLPVGLAFTVAVDQSATTGGTMRVQLGHYADQNKDGTTVSSETDLDFNWPVTIN